MEADATFLCRYARSRDADAYAQLVQRYAGMVYAVARRATGSVTDAEDVCQTCFLELAKRASQIRGPLATYLHKAAAHRAADVVRNRATRHRHERAAATADAAAAIDEHAELDAIVVQVDAALAELPDDLRLPLIEHYLRGQSQANVAAALGVNQSTVSRRLRDGVERLREALAHQGITTSPAIVPLALAHEAALPLPSSLGATLGKLALSGEPVTSGTGRGDAMGLGKLAAGVATAIGAIAIIFVVIVPGTAPTRPAAVPATAPAAPPLAFSPPANTSPVDEATLPGINVMARFDVLLDADAIGPIRDATPMPILMSGNFFDARRGSAGAVLNAVRLASRSARLRGGSSDMIHQRLVSNRRADLPFMNTLGNVYVDTLLIDDQRFTVSLGSSGSDSVRQVPRGFELKLTDATFNTFLQEYSREPREMRDEKSEPINLTATLNPGEAVLLLHDYRPMRGRHFFSATVWHVYRATEAQYQRTRRIRLAQEWVNVGPHGTRQLSDRAIAWGGEPITTAAVDPRWTRKLSNGATVRLMASGRPERWLFCWWDGNGNPIGNDWTELTIGLNTQRAVAIEIEYSDAEQAALRKSLGYLPGSGAYAIQPIYVASKCGLARARGANDLSPLASRSRLRTASFDFRRSSRRTA
jgi:RNA polymerase sigma factor (sigma-70 family)